MFLPGMCFLLLSFALGRFSMVSMAFGFCWLSLFHGFCGSSLLWFTCVLGLHRWPVWLGVGGHCCGLFFGFLLLGAGFPEALEALRQAQAASETAAPREPAGFVQGTWPDLTVMKRTQKN